MTEESDVQPLKASSLILVTESGIVIPESFKQFLNEFMGIDVSPVVCDNSRFTLYVEFLIAFAIVVKSLSDSSPVTSIVEFSVNEAISELKISLVAV